MQMRTSPIVSFVREPADLALPFREVRYSVDQAGYRNNDAFNNVFGQAIPPAAFSFASRALCRP